MPESHIIVHTPDSSLASPVKMVREMFHDLAASRELAWRLTVRDIKVHYRQVCLGTLLSLAWLPAQSIIV